MRNIAELGAAAAVRERSAKACNTVIAYAEGGEFLRHTVERIVAVVAHIVGIARKAVVIGAKRIGHIALSGFSAIVKML